MSKEGVSFKNRDRFIQLGIAISTLRKLRGMSQDQLAEKANMSRSHLSAIEAPNMIRSFSFSFCKTSGSFRFQLLRLYEIF